MGLKGPDGALSSIVLVHVQRYQLLLYPPVLSHEFLLLRAGLIVKDLEVDMEAVDLEPQHDVIVGFKVVFVSAR